jgi:uncharacterized protein YndB with AHSA1/START domain
MTSAESQDPSGRLVHLEIEVPGTPEQVWQAIATSAGLAGWIFPTDIEPREGGAMVIHRAPYGGDAPATVSAWDPPRRFAYEEPMGAAEAAPWATEFLVEARVGGTCLVRLVSGFHEHGEQWEQLVEGAGEGWKGALLTLRAYLTHFAGQPVARLDATGNTGEPLANRAKVSAALLGALGLTGLAGGDSFKAPGDAPPLAGVVETASVFGELSGHGVLLHTTQPAPGLFEISTFTMDGETVTVNVSGRLYGAGVDKIAGRDEPRWNAWLQERFLTPATA